MRVEIMVIAKSDYRVASAPRLDRLDLVPFGWERQRDGRGSGRLKTRTLALPVEGSYERRFLPERTDSERCPIAGTSLCFRQRMELNGAFSNPRLHLQLTQLCALHDRLANAAAVARRPSSGLASSPMNTGPLSPRRPAGAWMLGWAQFAKVTRKAG